MVTRCPSSSHDSYTRAHMLGCLEGFDVYDGQHWPGATHYEVMLVQRWEDRKLTCRWSWDVLMVSRVWWVILDASAWSGGWKSLPFVLPEGRTDGINWLRKGVSAALRSKAVSSVFGHCHPHEKFLLHSLSSLCKLAYSSGHSWASLCIYGKYCIEEYNILKFWVQKRYY